MPTYGYKCESCGQDFEVVQKVTDESIKECPDCGGKTYKIFYPVGIIFRGSGFHITDYCRPKEAGKEKVSSDSPSSAESKSETEPKSTNLSKKAS